MRQVIVLLMMAAASSTVHADNSVAFTQGHEELSNGYQSWRETSLQYTHGFASRHALSMGILETRRFGLSDTQLNASYTHPLNEKLTTTVEGNASPTSRVLARNSIGGTIQYEFMPAWLLHAGAKTTSYDSARVNQSLLMLERYISNFSWSIGWRPSRAYGTTAHSGEVRGSYYYGDKDSVSLILAAGEEAATIGSRVELTDVRSVALVGRHQINRSWMLVYSAGNTRQGDFYTRNGVGIGIQYTY